MTTTKAVVSLLPDHVPGEAFTKASRCREDLFDCLTARGDELFDLTDASLCADGPAFLSLAAAICCYKRLRRLTMARTSSVG